MPVSYYCTKTLCEGSTGIFVNQNASGGVYCQGMRRDWALTKHTHIWSNCFVKDLHITALEVFSSIRKI